MQKSLNVSIKTVESKVIKDSDALLHRDRTCVKKNLCCDYHSKYDKKYFFNSFCFMLSDQCPINAQFNVA